MLRPQKIGNTRYVRAVLAGKLNVNRRNRGRRSWYFGEESSRERNRRRNKGRKLRKSRFIDVRV